VIAFVPAVLLVALSVQLASIFFNIISITLSSRTNEASVGIYRMKIYGTSGRARTESHTASTGLGW
jgi:hypothetical protein